MKKNSSAQGRFVYVVDGCRTPFLKAKDIGPFSSADLAVASGRTLLSRQSFSPDDLDEVIIGSAMPGPDEANIARIVALRLGCGDKVPAFTVMRNCASGMQAIDSAAMDIAAGRRVIRQCCLVKKWHPGLAIGAPPKGINNDWRHWLNFVFLS